MCLPALGVLGAIASIGSSVAGFAGAQAQADAQNQYYMDNARASQRAAAQSYANLNVRQEQTRTSAVQDATETAIAAAEKRGTAQVAASEAGVAGLSVDALIGNIYAQEGRRIDRIGQQFSADTQQIRTQMDDTQAQSQQRINSVQRAAQPSPLGFIFQGLGGAIGAFGKQGMGTV